MNSYIVFFYALGLGIGTVAATFGMILVEPVLMFTGVAVWYAGCILAYAAERAAGTPPQTPRPSAPARRTTGRAGHVRPGDRVLPVVLALIHFTAVGCGSSDAVPADKQVAHLIPAPACAPVDIAAIPDKSRSGPANRTPELRLDHLAPVLDLLRVCGGQLAIGFINEQSNRPLTRLYVPAPPALRPLARPDMEGNPFLAAQELERYRDDSTHYAHERARHRVHVDSLIEDFSRRIADALLAPPEAGATDVFSVLARAEHFHAEPSIWPSPSVKITVLITDAIDTVGAPRVPAPLPSGAQLLLVSGIPDVGVLEPYHPVRFESIESAIRYVIHTYGPQNQTLIQP